MKDFSVRDITIYRPWDHEMPVDIVGDDAYPDQVRVAKLKGTVIGAYRIEAADSRRFEIRAVAVHDAYRRHGVGRWLLGHAIGFAESHGGDTVDIPLTRDGPMDADWKFRFFEGVGFCRLDDCLRLELTPE